MNLVSVCKSLFCT